MWCSYFDSVDGSPFEVPIRVKQPISSAASAHATPSNSTNSKAPAPPKEEAVQGTSMFPTCFKYVFRFCIVALDCIQNLFTKQAYTLAMSHILSPPNYHRNADHTDIRGFSQHGAGALHSKEGNCEGPSPPADDSGTIAACSFASHIFVQREGQTLQPCSDSL